MDETQRSILIRRVKHRLAALGVLVGFIVAVLVIVYFAAPQWLLRAAEMYQAQRAGLQTRSVQAGDTRWVYYEGGKRDAPTLILLHGYMGNRQAWLPMAPSLTPNFHVIIPDLPGWGASTRIANADYGYPAQAKRLHQFVQALHLGGIALAGHSMGGAIAGLYASQHPGDVGALILIDSAGAPFKDNAFTRELKAGRNPFDVKSRAQFEQLEKSLFANPPWLPPRIQDVFVNRAIRDRAFDDRVLKEIASPAQREVLTAALPAVTAPTLAIWCRQDRIIDVSALDAIRDDLKAAPRIGVTEFNDCGHMSIMERARESADAITRFALMP
ncbi:MAG TPA: alpha/beta fold hydrolase [Rhodanobacteraceae bacterium]|nr:alpha/beta fold hydrolase [Rhodanobacteraceae bacterium]